MKPSTGSPHQVRSPRVTVVVVAWNRRELLVEAVAAILAQTAPLHRLIVVDNASTDSSGEAAAAVSARVEVVTLDRNTGGAGGFAAGLAVAVEDAETDFVWLMDDDTIPEKTALEALLAAAVPLGAVVAGSRVVWTDGLDHPMNTPRPKPLASRRERRAAASRGAVAVRTSSFVSMLVSAASVRTLGLPVADYFIWNDDFEYSARLIRHGAGLHVPASVVVHKTAARADTDVDPGARFAFEVRNKLWMFLRSDALGPLDRVLYGGSSLARWGRTFLRSRGRRVLVAGLRSGLRDGLRGGPRPTAQVLAGLGPASEAVARVEAGASRGS